MIVTAYYDYNVNNYSSLLFRFLLPFPILFWTLFASFKRVFRFAFLSAKQRKFCLRQHLRLWFHAKEHAFKNKNSTSKFLTFKQPTVLNVVLWARFQPCAFDSCLPLDVASFGQSRLAMQKVGAAVKRVNTFRLNCTRKILSVLTERTKFKESNPH